MAEWKKNKDRNARIKELRANGMSVREIAKELNCSKSSVSYHCKGTTNNTRKTNNLPGSKKAKEIWENRIQDVCADARARWDELKSDPVFMGFLGIYWGEGNKASGSSEIGTGVVGITNNDHQLVLKVCDQLRTMTIKNLKADVIFYRNHNPVKCKKFWQDLLPYVSISMRENTDIRSKIEWSGRCQNGRFQLKISDWRLYWRLITWINCWKESV